MIRTAWKSSITPEGARPIQWSVWMSSRCEISSSWPVSSATSRTSGNTLDTATYRAGTGDIYTAFDTLGGVAPGYGVIGYHVTTVTPPNTVPSADTRHRPLVQVTNTSGESSARAARRVRPINRVSNGKTDIVPRILRGA